MNVATIYSAQFRESMKHLWSIWKSKIPAYEDILVWREMVKHKIKQLTIETSCSLNLNKWITAKYEKRIEEIKDFNKYLNKKEFSYLQKLIKEFYENQSAAAKIRSRIKYFQKGEKSTNCFLNTGKKNGSDKTWNKIKCRD